MLFPVLLLVVFLFASALTFANKATATLPRVCFTTRLRPPVYFSHPILSRTQDVAINIATVPVWRRLHHNAAAAAERVSTMPSLASLQGNGGGRIPMGHFSYDVSRPQLAAIIAAMPAEQSRVMHVAVRQGDVVVAQRLLREATDHYFSAPAAPIAAPIVPRLPIRRNKRISKTA